MSITTIAVIRAESHTDKTEDIFWKIQLKIIITSRIHCFMHLVHRIHTVLQMSKYDVSSSPIIWNKDFKDDMVNTE